MNEIKVWIHDGSRYMMPHWILAKNLQKYIQEWKSVLLPEAKKKNADHYVYCTIEYDTDGKVSELNIYGIPLNEAEFRKRTDAVAKCNPNTYIGAWHKGTTY